MTDQTEIEKREEFHQLAVEMKKWFEERDLSLGFTDTYYGHLALLIQKKMEDAFLRGQKKVQTTIQGRINKSRHKKVALGICVTCTKKVSPNNRWYCTEHRDIMRMKQRILNRKRKLKQKESNG